MMRSEGANDAANNHSKLGMQQDMFFEPENVDIDYQNLPSNAPGGPVVVPRFVSEKINIIEFQKSVEDVIREWKNELEHSEFSSLSFDISTEDMKHYSLDQSLSKIFDEFYPLDKADPGVIASSKKCTEGDAERNSENATNLVSRTMRGKSKLGRHASKKKSGEKNSFDRVVNTQADQANTTTESQQANETGQSSKLIEMDRINEFNGRINQQSQVCHADQSTQSIQDAQITQNDFTEKDDLTKTINEVVAGSPISANEPIHQFHQTTHPSEPIQVNQISHVEEMNRVNPIDQICQTDHPYKPFQVTHSDTLPESTVGEVADKVDEFGGGMDDEDDEDELFLNLANITLKKYSHFSPGVSSSMTAEDMDEEEGRNEERKTGTDYAKSLEAPGNNPPINSNYDESTLNSPPASDSYSHGDDITNYVGNKTNEIQTNEESTDTNSTEQGKGRKRKRSDVFCNSARKSSAVEYRKRINEQSEKIKEEMVREKINRVLEIINQRKANSTLHSVKEWKSNNSEISASKYLRREDRKKFRELNFTDVISDITLKPYSNYIVPKKTISAESAFVPIDKNEVVITVQILNPEKNYTLTEEIVVLGSQKLTCLKDKIYCLFDIIANDFQQNIPSSFFCIQDVFYNDMRDENAKDYSLVYRQFNLKERELAKKKNDDILSSIASSSFDSSHPVSSTSTSSPSKKHKNRKELPINLPPLYSFKNMEDVKFNELNIQIGSRYAYLHLGGCKHAIVFSDIRLIHPLDDQNYNSYPLVKCSQKWRRRKCQGCGIFASTKIVYEDKLAPESPFYLCDQCYFHLHYSETSTILYSDFRVYNYHHE